MYGRSNMETYITICKVDKIANGNLLYGSGDANRGSISIESGGMGGRLERVSKGRGYMYPYG